MIETFHRRHFVGAIRKWISNNFYNKKKLPSCDHVFNTQNIVKYLSDIRSTDMVIFHLGNINSLCPYWVALYKYFQLVLECFTKRPWFTPPEGYIHQNISEDKVFTININMWVVPKSLEISHCLDSRHSMSFNIEIISQIVCYLGSQLFEVLGKSDESIH